MLLWRVRWSLRDEKERKKRGFEIETLSPEGGCLCGRKIGRVVSSQLVLYFYFFFS